MKRKPITILQAMADPHLFKPWFRDPATWGAWRGFLCALFALPMSDAEREIFTACTGRTEAPAAPATEGWLVCGRRSGKSFTLALVAVFLGCFHDYRQFLSPGERGTILIIATDRKQARVIFRYIRAMLTQVPMLAKLVEREMAEAFELTNNVVIEVATVNFRTVRGYTVIAALLDELAFWPTDDSANPDSEVIAAIRPAMATIPGAKLLCASSPYAKRGALYDAFKRHHGKDGPVLVWQAPTLTMNPTVPASEVAEAMERDAASASAEWMAMFRDDVAGFIDREAVMACVEAGVRERAPTGRYHYFCFVDPSGGASDSMTCAIGHTEGNMIVIDALREIVAPFDPESAVSEFAALFGFYSVRAVHGDRYASAWCSQAFEKRRIEYRHSELPKSALYSNLLPYLNSRTIRLLDHPRSINQIAALERRTARGGRDSIDHSPGSRDDVANAVAGLCYVAARRNDVPTAKSARFVVSR
jgi:hypothetical protein